MTSPSDILPIGYYADDWKTDTPCKGDDRFLTKQLDERPLVRMCLRCPFLVECGDYSDEWQLTGVFVAGEWRPDVEDGDVND